MALNLSTLTSPATSDDVLAEVLTTADFLEPVPVLRNLARGSNKGGDAKQDVALNQPKALPLIDGDGYLYLSGVTGNYAEVNSPILAVSGDFDVSVDLYYTGSTGDRQTIFSQYDAADSGRFFIYIDSSNYLSIFWGGTFYVSSTVVPEGRNTIRVTKSGNTVTTYLNGVQAGSATRTGLTQVNLLIGIIDLSGTFVYPFKGAIFSVTEANGLLNCDFTATAVRHGDTKFQCATGQTVTINQDSSSSNDVSTIIKKPVLRFDGVNSSLQGLFDQTITDGYMFAAFSVLGGGGQGGARVFGVNPTGGQDYADGFIFGYRSSGSLYQSLFNGGVLPHLNTFDDERGDILIEARIESGNHSGRVNNADFVTGGNTGTKSGDEFNIAADHGGVQNAAIDLEYLALFDASITDAQADDVRKYINNRNNVFYRWDTDGYYFYNPQDLSSGAVTTWNGRIVGSDNGDVDKNATQSTSADQPTSDGYKVTFADNTDHFDIPSTTQAGWQVVGTSLGTFAYRVNANAVTELNLLGNAGVSRRTGDLYGVILLPESATGREIEQARKLLIDRGAADGTNSINFYSAWNQRSDMVEFKNVDMSSVTNVGYAWASSALTSFSTPLPSVTYAADSFRTCTSLTSFSAELPSATDVRSAWVGCSSLTSFSAELPSATDVRSAWVGCSSLTSFSSELPSATSVSSAWRGCSSLTSFDTPLPSVTNLSSAFQDCTQLAEIGQLQTSNVRNWFYSFYNCSALLSFPVLDTSSGTEFFGTWRGCSGLTQFPLLNCNSGLRFSWTFEGCSSLEDFPAGFFDNWNPSSISDGVFNNTWNGCSSLTAQSVENILTSIDSSNQHATSDGTSGGTPLSDSGIDIDYDGSGLTSETTAAITSLKSKGWSIFINSVEQ